MISDNSKANDFDLEAIAGRASPNDVNEPVINALKDVHRLLEAYAPKWYTEELYNKIVAALPASETASDRLLDGGRPLSQTA